MAKQPAEDLPFRGRELTRKEKKAAARRAAERAAAKAMAMPPPDPSRRQDVTGLPGRPGSPMQVGQAQHLPVSSAQQMPARYPGQFPPAGPPPAPVAQYPTVAPTWRPGTGPSLADVIASSGSSAAGTSGLERGAVGFAARVRGAWGRKASTSAVIAGLIAFVASICVGVGVGAPVLDHAGKPLVALAGATGAIAGLLLTAKGWQFAARLPRFASAALALLLTASFCVGTFTNPVVVDGEVFLATSTKAKSYRLIQELRADLLAMSDDDRYLTYDQAEAGAHFDEYDDVTNRLKALTDKYSRLSEDVNRLPDERFAPVVTQTKAAAYWAYRASLAKVQTLEQDNAKSQADLADARASFADSLIQSGTTLKTLSAQLDLPLTSMGPHE